MGKDGFAAQDYNVMENSCNTFTEEVARRLDVLDNYPAAIHTQTRLGEILCPVVKALDYIPESRSPSPRPSMSAPPGRPAAAASAATTRRKLSIASVTATVASGECQKEPPANGPVPEQELPE